MGGIPRQEQQQILLQPLVWQRRQMPSQQVITGLAPMERVEKTNTVMVRGQGQEVRAPPRGNFYAMKVDRGRNYYICGRFGHMVCYYRNWERRRVAEGKRLEYEGRREGLYEYENYLKEEKNLTKFS